MDEADVQHKARTFCKKVDVRDACRDPSIYASAANARVRAEQLGPGEAACTFRRPDESSVIIVNAAEPVERQRFSICHEIAHIVLGLPSSHAEIPSGVYPKRDQNEIACDVFAVELLLPSHLWLQAVSSREPTEALIRDLASHFRVSIPVAKSRYAALAEMPSAFIWMEGGTIRGVARNARVRQLGASIRTRTPIPNTSVAQRLRSSERTAFETNVVPQDVWIDDWETGYELTEIARHNSSFDTTTSLLWFYADDAPEQEVDRFGRPVDEDELLPELTGNLPWPGKSKRRR